MPALEWAEPATGPAGQGKKTTVEAGLKQHTLTWTYSEKWAIFIGYIILHYAVWLNKSQICQKNELAWHGLPGLFMVTVKYKIYFVWLLYILMRGKTFPWWFISFCAVISVCETACLSPHNYEILSVANWPFLWRRRSPWSCCCGGHFS